MYNDRNKIAQTPMIDEFAIYERKLSANEIDNHNKSCVLPSNKVGWNKNISHKDYAALTRFNSVNDTVLGLNSGSMKAYSVSEAAGVKYFEINVNHEWYGDGMVERTGQGFGVGVSDKEANESGLMYINPNREYPCFENHIMLWVTVNDDDDDDVDVDEEVLLPDVFLSVAVMGNYENIMIPPSEASYIIRKINFDIEFSLTFTIAIDFTQKYILFYCDGKIITTYEITSVAFPHFLPTFSSDLSYKTQES